MKKLLLLSLLFPALASAQFHQWSFNNGGVHECFGSDVVVDAAGNSYVTGHYKGSVDFDPGSGTATRIAAGGYDVFVASYDAAGNYRWVSTMGSWVDDHGVKLCLDNYGHVNITGNIVGTADADPGAGVFSLSASINGSGAFVWQLDAATGSFSGAIVIDALAQGNAIAVDGSGNIFITGVFNMNADFDPGTGTAMLNIIVGNEDLFVAKYDINLNYAWAFALGGYGIDNGLSIATDAANNIYVGGYLTGNTDLDAGSGTTLLGATGGPEGFIVSYNNNGQFLWGFAIQSSGAEAVTGLHVHNSLLYACGYYGGTVDFDPSANTANLLNNVPPDAFFAQYTTSGSYNWAKKISYISAQNCKDITTDVNGDVYITGRISWTSLGTDFDPGSGEYRIQGFGGDDIFIARYTAQGTFTWAFAVGSSIGHDIGSGIAVQGGELWTTGYFIGNPDFDPAGATALLNAGTSTDIFVAKYGTAFVGISENQTEITATLFPNPATEAATLQFSLYTPGEVNISLFDLSGKLIRAEKYTQRLAGYQSLQVDVTDLTPGIYLLRIETAGGTQHLRLCKQ